MAGEFARALELELIRAEWEIQYAFIEECNRGIWGIVESPAEIWHRVVAIRGGFS